MNPYVQNVVWPNVVSFLEFPEACRLRDVCSELRDCVGAFYRNGITLRSPHGSSTKNVRALQKRFPANRDWTFITHFGDGSLAPLKRSARSVTLIGCKALTDAGLKHLRGVHTVRILPPRPGATFICHITDAGLAHLAGIHTLEIAGHSDFTDAGLAHLAGIQSLRLTRGFRITDAGLAYLAGIHTLDLQRLDASRNITDAGLVHLAGIHTLKLSNHHGQITDIGIAALRGIHTLLLDGDVIDRIPWWNKSLIPITWAGLSQLKGIQELNVWCGCEPNRSNEWYNRPPTPDWMKSFAGRMNHYREAHGLRV